MVGVSFDENILHCKRRSDLVVMGRDLQSEGCESESQLCMDIFLRKFVLKLH